MIEDNSWYCQHSNLELTKRLASDSSVRFVNQCLDCGRAIGTQISKKKVANPDDVVSFDSGLSDSYHARRKQKYEAGRKEREEARRLWYQEYLRSAEWAERREHVLTRCGFLCEGCLTLAATEVHHLHYNNVGHEFMFELVGLCSPCHRRYHNK